MIDQETRKAIFCLHEKGLGIREIARKLKMNRHTVSQIIIQKGGMPDRIRKDKVMVDEELIHRLYADCQGRVQRIYERLNEEEGVDIGYSTLTRLVRDLGLVKGRKDRCGRVPDQPGQEMQHDTSEYIVRLGETNRKVIGSLLYFRYSKMRYLMFYRSFNRFKMKCFFHEAMVHFGYTAKECIIDNTNLARLRGTGKDAVIVPEMESFSSRYGFKFICHEKGHSNRKAGNEKGFYTVETNFFPGRQFESLVDLNSQAFSWATERLAKRPTGKSGLIPAKTFEFEQPFLIRLMPHIPAPYISGTRMIDQYGYVAYDGNYYWVPGSGRYQVTLLAYSRHIDIYRDRKLLVSYPLPTDGAKNQLFRSGDSPGTIHQPQSRKKSAQAEETSLRALSEEVKSYLDFLGKQTGIKKHHFIRWLYGLSKKVALPVFSQCLQRALKYKIFDIETIERICMLVLKSGGSYPMPLFDLDEHFHSRDSYLEGEFSDEADLSCYDRLLDDENG